MIGKRNTVIVSLFVQPVIKSTTVTVYTVFIVFEATGFNILGSSNLNEGDHVIDTEPEVVGLPPITVEENTGIVYVGPASTEGKENVETTTLSVSEQPETDDVATKT